MKKVTIIVEYCNSSCPHFYHRYADYENIWCDLINEMVYVAGESDMVWNDYKKRPIPTQCKLEDVE